MRCTSGLSLSVVYQPLDRDVQTQLLDSNDGSELDTLAAATSRGVQDLDLELCHFYLGPFCITNIYNFS